MLEVRPYDELPEAVKIKGKSAEWDFARGFCQSLPKRCDSQYLAYRINSKTIIVAEQNVFNALIEDDYVLPKEPSRIIFSSPRLGKELEEILFIGLTRGSIQGICLAAELSQNDQDIQLNYFNAFGTHKENEISGMANMREELERLFTIGIQNLLGKQDNQH